MVLERAGTVISGSRDVDRGGRVPLRLKNVIVLQSQGLSALVGTVLSYVDHKRRSPGGRARSVEPVITEILEALLTLGGSAHRQAVADEVCLRRVGRSGSTESAARDEIYGAFDAYLARVATRKAPPLLWLTLGSGSYRWSLKDVGQDLFQTGAPALRMVR